MGLSERFLRPRAYTADQFREMARGRSFISVELKDNAVDFEVRLQR